MLGNWYNEEFKIGIIISKKQLIQFEKGVEIIRRTIDLVWSNDHTILLDSEFSVAKVSDDKLWLAKTDFVNIGKNEWLREFDRINSSA